VSIPRILVAIALGLLVAGCASLPKNVERQPSTALANTDDTRLGRAVARRVASNPGLSGIHSLSNAREAFAARILLARAADRTLDLQYYIWHNDTTGQLLFDAMWQAANRGVRIRMLLDDANAWARSYDRGARRTPEHTNQALQSVRDPRVQAGRFRH